MAGPQPRPEGEAEAARPPEGVDWLTRVVSVLSALLVVAVIGYLVRDAMRPERPASFVVRTGAVRHVAESYEIPVRVRNVGDAAAKDVMVHVSIASGERTVGESEITIDWLPGRSDHEATAVFREDPAGLRVSSEVTGYNTP
jgi:uncharacterized protein (TIGR02588 family)